MQQPVEVQVDEHEQIVERVAAIDVAKASGMVCLRVPHPSIPGRRVTKWTLAPHSCKSTASSAAEEPPPMTVTSRDRKRSISA